MPAEEGTWICGARGDESWCGRPRGALADQRGRQPAGSNSSRRDPRAAQASTAVTPPPAGPHQAAATRTTAWPAEIAAARTEFVDPQRPRPPGLRWQGPPRCPPGATQAQTHPRRRTYGRLQRRVRLARLLTATETPYPGTDLTWSAPSRPLNPAPITARVEWTLGDVRGKSTPESAAGERVMSLDPATVNALASASTPRRTSVARSAQGG